MHARMGATDAMRCMHACMPRRVAAAPPVGEVDRPGVRSFARLAREEDHG